jgi:C4-dicarboxylate-specific signal transduction histidine kinase
VRSSSHARLSIRLALASVGTVVAITVVCAVGLVSVRQVGSVSRSAVSGRIATIHDSSAFQRLLYQKGLVAEYMLTGDRVWLAQLEESRAAFARWLENARSGGVATSAAALLPQIESEYAAYDGSRARAITVFDAGRIEDAKAMLGGTQEHARNLLALVQRFDRAEAAEAEHSLVAAEASARRRAEIIVGTSIVGILVSVAAGFLWARRMARPIYQLQLRVQSAAERMHVEVSSATGDLDELSQQVVEIARKVEDTDAALVEHRRRLLQSEKLSAVGELAAKLAHEILNPLAGMKVAVQVLARSERGAQEAARETAATLGREIARVEELVHRLLDYARPLGPRLERCSVSRLVDGALEATRKVMSDAGSAVELCEDASLPLIEVDPLLMTQVLANVLANAAQAMAPTGGIVRIRVGRATELGHEQVRIEVADQGPGIAAENRERIFHPFFTTKHKGHGLGLAISQNILLEHGGRISARNRDDERGAVFELLIPLGR